MMLRHAKAKKFKQRGKVAERKQAILREKKLFVLDNSLRESTVGQIRGHTIENKWKIYEEVSAMIIESFEISSLNGMITVRA